MEIVEDKQVGMAQHDKIIEQYFNVKGIINLDRNDVDYTLGHKDGLLIVAKQGDEDNKSFLDSFFKWLLERQGIKEYRRFLFYFGNPVDHPLRMSELTIVSDFCSQLEDASIIWGVYDEAEGSGATAIAVCGGTNQ